MEKFSSPISYSPVAIEIALHVSLVQWYVVYE